MCQPGDQFCTNCGTNGNRLTCVMNASGCMTAVGGVLIRACSDFVVREPLGALNGACPSSITSNGIKYIATGMAATVPDPNTGDEHCAGG